MTILKDKALTMKMMTLLGWVCLLQLPLPVSAQTSLYGHANGFAQTRTVEGGTALELHGHLTEFGFINLTRLSPSLDAGFDMNFGMNLLDSWSPYLRDSELTLSGTLGELALYFGDTPLTESNHWLVLMHQDPDNLPIALDFGSANPLRLPVGVTATDGLRYRSLPIADRFSYAAALIPAEQVRGETGYSFVAMLKSEGVTSLAGFELNGAYADSLLFRLMTQVERQRLTFGALAQASLNTATESERQTGLLYGFWPWQAGEQAMRAKAMIALNRTTDQNDEATTQVYVSALNEVPLTQKLSLYGFGESEWEPDAGNLTIYLGAGAALRF